MALFGLAAGILLWQRSQSVRDAAWIGWALGFGTFLGALNWLVNPFLVEPLRHGWMIPFALSFMCGGLALLWAGAFAAARGVKLGTFGLLALWTAIELARGWIFTGFPWALPAYIWLDTSVAFWSAVLGPYGLTGLTLALAALLAQVGMRKHLNGRGVGLLALVFIAIFGGGHLLGEQAHTADTTTRVRVVQPNAPQHQKWDPRYIPVFYDLALQLSDASQADLVVWPETALAQMLNFAEPQLREIAERVAPATAVVGGRRIDGRRGYNSIAVIGEGGALDAVYDKHHLVPFGEYLPLPQVLSTLGFGTFTASEGYGFSAGAGPQLLDFGAAGRALPLICYEAIFPRDLRGTERPDFLLHLTNDAWFGRFAGPQQSLAQARFRAIETGLPMVRAANTGISAVIDPRGEIRRSVPLGQAGAVTAPLPEAAAPTIYSRFHETGVAILIAAFAILGGLAQFLRRKVVTRA